MSATDAKVSIYALCDEDGTERYVGQTIHPLAHRLQAHCAPSGRRNADLEAWIAALRARGMRPQIKLLEVVDLPQGRAAETRYITTLRASGKPLLNRRLGLTPPSLYVIPRDQRHCYVAAPAPTALAPAQRATTTTGRAVQATTPAPVREREARRVTFGQRLRALRQRRLLTQAELAALLGVDQRQISWWETGGAVPRVKRQRQLCEALGVSAEELAGGKPP